jgi:AraC-like DNA-binding protein
MYHSFINDRTPFYISRRKMVNYHGQHVHDFFEILYLFSGERFFFINDRTFKMKEGDLILINPNALHKATSNETLDCEGILIYFYEDYLAPNRPVREILAPLFKNETISVSLDINERALIDELFLKMLQEFRIKNTGFELALQALLLQLLIFLCRNIKGRNITAYEHLSPMHEKVSEIARYINKHYPEPLSLTSLADLFYISPSYLSKVFKETTNFTFIEYLNNVRVKEAKRLLMESQAKVVEIAEQVGFGSVTNFGRVFKEVTSHPPLYYRKLGK